MYNPGAATGGKAELRQKFGAIRAAIPRWERERRSTSIQARLLGYDRYLTGGAVFTYIAKGDEVGTLELITAAWAEGRRVAAPRCLDANGRMAFYWIQSWGDVQPGRFGVLEPVETCPPAQAEENDLCVVPALSFDASGYRLGYGKGYYDRFLSGFPGVSVGFCFEACMTWRLPRDSYDRPVDAVITDGYIREI